jgi:hypothetical protein
VRRTRLTILSLLGLLVAAALGGGIALWSARHAEQAPADIRQFLESYFSTWSAGDMAGYKSHFDPDAQIAMVHEGEVVYVASLEPFVAEQAKAIRESPERMVERMTTFTADADAAAAQATAGWELKKGSRTVTGVDRFTLIRNPQREWKILFLVFYER